MIGLFRRAVREGWRLCLLVAAWSWIQTHPNAAAEIRAEKSWLFGCSDGWSFDDNSAVLYQFVRANLPHISAYFVIRPGSADYRKAVESGPVLAHNTVRAFVYGWLATTHISSHGPHDVPTMAYRRASGLVRVRLGHGLTALKRGGTRLGKSAAQTNSLYDLIPVASEFERNNKRDWGVDVSRSPITGISRLDRLYRARSSAIPRPGKILFMPTWRDGSTKRTKALREALILLSNSRELNEMLVQFGIQIHLILHRNLPRSWTKLFLDGRVIKTAVGDIVSNMSDAELFVTDYSSVCWDALYVNIPVIFYRPDEEAQNAARPGYIDEAGLPGPVAFSPESFSRLISQAFSPIGSEMFAPFSGWRDVAFQWRDSNNCRRTTDAVLRCLAEKQIGTRS